MQDSNLGTHVSDKPKGGGGGGTPVVNSPDGCKHTHLCMACTVNFGYDELSVITKVRCNIPSVAMAIRLMWYIRTRVIVSWHMLTSEYTHYLK